MVGGRKTIGGLIAAIVVLLVLLIGYAGKGWIDATSDAPALAQRADGLLAKGLGGDGLGEQRLGWLIKVQDPGFWNHNGLDMKTLGAGKTTISQSLSKRLAFTDFRQGVQKIRQTSYAMSLERRLSKEQILALFLDTVPMGPGPDGWMTGFYTASEAMFQRPPKDIEDGEFLNLVAVMIAPGKFNLTKPDIKLRDRVLRIALLLIGDCEPAGHNDVWLEGCG